MNQCSGRASLGVAEGFKQILSFHPYPTSDCTLDILMVCKELVFFHTDLFFACLPFTLNFFFRNNNAGQREAQTKPENTFWEKIKDISGPSPLSVPRKSGRRFCCLPETTTRLYWKIMGWIWDRVIKLRVLLQKIPTPFFAAGQGWAAEQSAG